MSAVLAKVLISLPSWSAGPNSVLTPNCFLFSHLRQCWCVYLPRIHQSTVSCNSRVVYIFSFMWNNDFTGLFSLSPSVLIIFCPSVLLLLSGVAVINKSDVSRIQTATTERQVW